MNNQGNPGYERQHNEGVNMTPIANQPIPLQQNPVGFPVQMQSLDHYPSNHKCLACTGLICTGCTYCCCPIGMAAVASSNHVDMAMTMRNYEAADIHSRRTKTLAIVAIAVGTFLLILFFILAFTAGRKHF
eukprot:TCONS_00002430-protein